MAQETDTADDEEPEYAQVNVRVRKETKEEADKKLPHGGLTRAVRERISEIAHGHPTTEEQELRRELQQLRDRRRDLVADRDHINDQLDNLDVKIERLERELEALEREREVPLE